MTRRAVVTLAAVALGASVFVSSVATATGPCNKKVCSDEIAAGCVGLKGMALSACSKAVLLNCNTTDCSCTDPTLPMCTPTTTTTTTSTTTSSSTTSTTTSSTTTTTASPLGAFLEFTTGTPGGVCGETRDGNGVLIKTLTCGGLNVGGAGMIPLPEGLTAEGATTRFTLSCTGPNCTIGPFTTPPAPNSTDPDCSDTGCNFGTPLEIANVSLTTCVLNTFSSPAGGFLDGSTGAQAMDVVLSSAIFLTGNLAQPCPRCSATGTPSNPGMGTCNRGPNVNQPCTTTNSVGLTRDCPTDGLDGTLTAVLALDLSPLTTETVTVTAPTFVPFCPGQTAGGCFGSQHCRTIIENGSPAGPITPGTPANTTLASVFCIPGSTDPLVDFAFGLPGPGAVSLPGTSLVF
jgi:mucin-6/19